MPEKKNSVFAIGLAILVMGVCAAAIQEIPARIREVDYSLDRVACLGDSITEVTGYPELLQMMLGNGSIVGNFGLSGATVNFNSSLPYYFRREFQHASFFLPTVVVIMLGTNDCRTNICSPVVNFVTQYKTIIGALQALSTKPEIFLVLPPPVFSNTIALNGTLFSEDLVPCIKQVSNEMNLHLIDVYMNLLNCPENLPDGVHPNIEGARTIANLVFETITTH